MLHVIRGVLGIIDVRSRELVVFRPTIQNSYSNELHYDHKDQENIFNYKLKKCDCLQS